MKRPYPDRRLSWRDPNMPVLREYRMPDGSIKREVPPEFEQGFREHQLNVTIGMNWRHDPTYNMRRKRR